MDADSRELLLLRHAKSSSNSSAGTDFDRPLAARGVRDAPRIGAWMLEDGLIPDAVVCSPALRARQTAEAALEAMGLDPGMARFEPRIYAADHVALLEVLAECPPTLRRVLMVGHNPGLEDLLALLGGETVTWPSEGRHFPTAALARLRMPEDWTTLAPGCAVLLELVRPRLLVDPGGDP